MAFGLAWMDFGIAFSTFIVLWTQQRCSRVDANTSRSAVQNPEAPSPIASLGSCFRPRRLRSSSTFAPALRALPHQIRRPSKGHAAGHTGVHPPLPDPYSTRRVSPHSALRPAGQFDPQGQHHKDPHIAVCTAPGTDHRVRTRRRDHPTHPA